MNGAPVRCSFCFLYDALYKIVIVEITSTQGADIYDICQKLSTQTQWLLRASKPD